MAVVSRGRFVWHELLTTDPTAVAFYEKAIGWTVMKWDQDPNYRMFAWNGVPMAGLMSMPGELASRGVPSHWTGYVTVPDVDATVAQAVGLGAVVHLQPMDVPTVGRVAAFHDPQGAAIGVFRPETPMERTDDPAMGDFSWHELITDDWKSAWEFYRALFGWEFDSQMDMGAAGTYWMFRRAGGPAAMGGMYNRPPEVPVSSWLAYIHVPSADRVATLAPQYGASVIAGPMEIPGGDRIAILMDPHGASIAVHSPKPRAAVAKPKAATKPKPKAAAKPKAKQKAATKKAPAKKRPAGKSARRPVKKAAPRKRR
jgi:predicted enzyme related to lactoylglutathione lyase